MSRYPVGVILGVADTQHNYAAEVEEHLGKELGCVVDFRYWVRTKSGRRDAFFTCRPAPTKNVELVAWARSLSLDDYYPECHAQLLAFGVPK